MKRRDFIKNVSIASVAVPFIAKNMNMHASTKAPFKIATAYEDRVLVLIRMNGGNDGLNTVVPIDQYANLMIQRPEILIPQNQLISLTPSVALHSAMTGMGQLFQQGKLSIIQNVGYPDQNRSHFRSSDIWHTGKMDITETDGWLGDMFQIDHPTFPDQYPNSDYPAPFAISMGYEASATCQGVQSNFSHVVSNPADVINLDPGTATFDGSYYGQQIEFLQTIIEQANAYGAQTNAAVAAGNNLSTLYQDNQVGNQLKYVAKMISGGLGTNVYIINIGGFDTHEGQIIPNNPTLGGHSDLLKEISDGVAAFMDDCQLLGISNRVSGITYSEFGRQVAANASFGTDHGDAAPMFLFGSCISQGIIGANPTISSTITDQEGIPMQIDFRNVYASFMKDWFGVPEMQIQNQFEQPIVFFPVMGGCNVYAGLDDNWVEKPVTQVYPNPVSSKANLQIHSENEAIKAILFDMNGRELKVVCEITLAEGVHHIPFEMSEFSSGMYLLKIERKGRVEEVRISKN